MSSIDKLLKCLQELSVCRQNILQLSKNSLFQENGEALKYCEDIEQIFNDIDNKELGLASKLLFDPNIGIIKFLLELINVFDKTLQKAKIALLEFLFLYIKKVKAGIEPYSEQIKEGCFSILQFDDEAFVRAASFKPMMAMFDFSIPIIDPEKLHIQDILKRYLDCIFVKSKMQASTKVMAGVLNTIGIIAHRFPKQSERDAEKILRVFVNMLKDPGNSNAAFKSLHSFLFSFPDMLRTAGHEKYVFECILRSIAMIENETRYEIAKLMAGVLNTIGIIAHRFPKQSERDAEKILRVFVNMLKDPGNSNAAFKSLHSFLFSFPDMLRTAGHEKYVFECILRSIAMIENETRYEIAKLGFDYIIDHSSIFGKYYLQHYEELWKCLWVCCEHINRDLKRSAFKAIGEFLKTTAKLLNSNPIGPDEEKCINYFISIFVNIWKTRNSEQEQKVEIETKDQYPKDLSIAVRGVGYFAAPAKKIMDKVKLQQLFQDLLKPGSLVVLSVDENEILANVYQIPLFIEAFCYIGQEFDVIFDELLETIEQEVRIMLIYYPRLIHDLRLRGANAFEQLLWMLYKKGSGVMRKFVSKMFYQALILTCSDAIQNQKLFDNQRQDIPNIIDTVADHTYQEMFHLWNHIFSDSTLLWVGHQTSEDIENNSDTAKEFFTILYDEFLLAVFRIIRALNFKVIDITTNTENIQELIDSNLIAIAGSSDLSNLQPVVSKDFIIFQNLVDFWQLFLPRIRKELFSRWVYLAGDNLISLSTQYPYVSGFYKMAGSCLKVCESIQYFIGVKNLDCEMENVSQSQFLPSTTSMQRVSYFLYSKFIKEVCARLIQYKDDLLASCLRLVLSVPKELLNINDLVSPICIALKLGQSYQPLANIGLDAIEKIVDLKGPQDLSKWLGQILPFLNDYLLVKADTMDNSLKEIAQFRANAQKNRNGLKSVEKARKQKIKESGMIKSFKTIVGVGQLEKNVGLYDLQVRVLRILGRLGGVNKLIIENISNEGTISKLNTQFKSSNFKNKSLTSSLLAWDPERRLKFTIPYPDCKIEIIFDEFLPRIVELAESAPDRKTKVISCELLHSIMLLMIGRSAFQARIIKGPQESPFCKIYHRIFPVLLRLAIDTDQVPRKLFRRLVSQLIHWFTNNAQYENPETMTLLQYEFLPRIVELAESAPDRKTKVISCELLHSIMLLMIGRSAFQARIIKGPQESPFCKIYHRIFPVLLRLAIDTDQVPRKLFRRLVSQLIHWFTNNAQYENPETMTLLQCCLDATCDSWGSLRDYGAECLNEFLLWSIKQSSNQQIEKDPLNIKSLFNRLYNASAHPDYTKRLGASLAINHIYRVFREEEYLVNHFTFELLYWTLFNLRLSEQDQDAIGTRQQAIMAIRHLKKIINLKSNLFLTKINNRRKFPGLAEANLLSLVNWLFMETSRKESDYANMCRELFTEFVVHIPDFKNGSNWVTAKISSQPSFLLDLYKTSFLSLSFDQNKGINFSQNKEWCARFLSFLENYTWIIKEKFVSPEILIQKEMFTLRDSINIFLNKMVLSIDLDHSLDILEFDDQSSNLIVDSEKFLTPAERSQLTKCRVKMTNIFIDFIIALLEAEINDNLNVRNTSIFSDLFFKALARWLFFAEKLELGSLINNNGNAYDGFSRKLYNLLSLFKRISHSDSLQFKNCIREISMVAFSKNADLLNIELESSAFSFKILNDAGIFDDLFDQNLDNFSSVHNYISLICDKIVSLRDVKYPHWIQLLNNLLTFVLSRNSNDINKWLLSDLIGYSRNSSTPSYEDSCNYYQKFSSSINDHLSKNFTKFAPLFCENISDLIIRDIMRGILDYLFYKKNHNQTMKFLNDFASSIYFLNKMANSCAGDQKFLLKLWKGLIKLDSNLLKRQFTDEFKQLFYDIYLTFLTPETELDFKSEAFDLLPAFLKSDMPKDKIEARIEEMLNYQFPLRSSEYSRDGPKKLNDYISVLDKLLKAMVQSNSITLFKIFVPTFVRETDHIYANEFQEQLGLFVSHLPGKKFVEMSDIAFGYFQDSNFANFHRNIIQSILTPILMQGSKNFVIDFYKKCIKELLDIIERDPRIRNDQERIYELDAKAGSFVLLQISFH
ncbi:hypothetical protein Glove_429g28 [Diversispora epigaea]|uniref:DNA-dependent protein kinase catalytic subunit n=1 Tax=Diversispora epigaea TaxID=1348612 RepID=A0A397GXM3_9GLOM|nr:hypothetical protein Glove_429g28 [Diversispora epigaea]